MPSLKPEFDFYVANKADFLAKYPGKFVVIKNQKLLGVYDDRLVAIQQTVNQHTLGTFLVQHVVEGDDQAYFHSRVVL